MKREFDPSLAQQHPGQRLTDEREGTQSLHLGEAIDSIARRHDFGRDAGRDLWHSIVQGRGIMAQFRHVEFGGRGQWMQGGMVMIADMFDRALAERVAAACDEMVALYRASFATHGGSASNDAHEPGLHANQADWWPAGLRDPACSGSQNGVRYAWFPPRARLVIERNGALEVYDTDDHWIGGAAQQQGRYSDLKFTSQHGPLALSELKRVPREPGNTVPCYAQPNP